MLKRKLSFLAILIVVAIMAFGIVACKSKEAHEHSLGGWISENGYHWKECDECDEKVEYAEHSFSEDWKTDNNSHWHECICGEQKDFGSHRFNEDDVCTTCLFSKGLKYEAKTEIKDGKEVIVAYYVTGMGEAFDDEIEIPSTYNQKPIIGIGEKAFYYSTSLKSIVIPNSITYIGSYAFQGCSALESVTIPSTIEYIGSHAFSGCDKLNYTEEDNAKYLGNTSNPHLVLIETEALEITSCTINANTVVIAGGAFEGCSYLTSVTIPEKVTSIGPWAFYDCLSLTEVNIGNGVKCIGEGAFHSCTGLTNITIPSSVTTIENSAFYLCHKLVEVKNLSGLTILDNSTDNGSIGLYAKNVYGATGSTKLVEEDDFIFYNGDETFLLGYKGTKNEITLPEKFNGQSYDIYDYAFYMNFNLSKVEISDNVTSIGKNAFHGCYALTSVTVGSNVASIGENAFEECFKLVEVYNLSGLDIKSASLDLGKVGQYALDVYNNKDAQSKLAKQGDFIFYNSEKSYLIGYTGNEHSLTLPEGESYEIYKYAFYNRLNLAELNVPSNVTAIGNKAFASCLTLTKVTIDKNVNTIGSNVFENCPIEEAVIPGVACELVKNNKLTTLTVVSGTVAADAFSGCKNLTTATLQEGVTAIEKNAFKNCSALTTISIPNSITSIGEKAFDGCTSLTYTVSDNAKYLGNESNPYLVLVSVKDKSEEDKTKDTSITSCAIHKDTKFILANAFTGCTKLVSITYAGSKTDWDAIVKATGWDTNTGAYELTCSN